MVVAAAPEVAADCCCVYYVYPIVIETPPLLSELLYLYYYYVYYYEVGNPAITDKFVSGLIALVNEHLQSVGVTSSAAVAETKAHYGQIVDLIKKKKVLLLRRQ